MSAFMGGSAPVAHGEGRAPSGMVENLVVRAGVGGRAELASSRRVQDAIAHSRLPHACATGGT